MVVRKFTNLLRASSTASNLILVTILGLVLLAAVITTLADGYSDLLPQDSPLKELSANTPQNVEQLDSSFMSDLDQVLMEDDQSVNNQLSEERPFRSPQMIGMDGTAVVAFDSLATLAPAMTTTKRDALLIDLDGDGQADPGDTLRYTIRIDNTGSSDATGAVFSDTIDSRTTLIPGSLNSTPIARDDFYQTRTNAAPLVISATNGLLANDNDPDGGPLTITPFNIPTGAGGTVSVAADGSFVYTQPLGYIGPDAFIYGARDSAGFLDPAVVSINVTSFGASTNNRVREDYSVTLSGETLNANLGTLNSGQVVVLSFDVMPDSPPPSWPAGIDGVCNQGKVSGTNFTDVLTNDPDSAAVGDPTCTPIDVTPDLRIIKGDGGISVRRNQTIPYSLAYSNVGRQDATGVTIRDIVPGNTTFSPGASTAGWTCSPNNNAGSSCAITIGAVPGSSGGGTVIFAVTVNNTTPNSVTQINNTAVIADDGANGTDPNPGDNSDSESTPLIPRPELSLLKDDGGVSAVPGDTLSYSLTYSNAGGGTNGVVLTDTVPSHTTFNPGASTAGWVCTPGNSAGSICTLNLGALAMGASGSASFAVNVNNSVPAGVVQLSNTAVIGDDGAYGPDTNPTNNSDSDTTPLVAQPDMVIIKDDGNITTHPGQTIAYNLAYSNNGNQGASGVTLQETVPANSTFNPGASTSGWTCTPNNNAGSSCALVIGSVAAGGNGTVVFAVNVNDPLPISVSLISNTASISDDGSNGTDPNPGDNSNSDTTPVIHRPDLGLTKDDGGALATPGTSLVYSLNFNNVGGGATGVVLTETIPAHTTFNPGASSPGWVCTPDNNAGSICTLSIGMLAMSGSGSSSFAVDVDIPLPSGVSQLSNTAVIGDDGSNGPDSNPADNSATEITLVVAQPDLAITKDDGGISVRPGESISYTLAYANNGNQGATGVILQETVPAHTTFNPGASTPGWVCTPDNNAGSSCDLAIGALASSGGGLSIFAVDVDNPLAAGVTQIDNTAVIADDGANGPDPNPADNSASESTPIIMAPDLILTKSDGGVTVAPGDALFYSLNYSNIGGDATGVVMTDTVPTHTTFVPWASAGWTCAPDNSAGSLCTLVIGSLAKGQSGSASFTVMLDNTLPTGVDQLTNTAVIADDGTYGPDANPADNSATKNTPVDARPDLAINKDDGGASAIPGGNVAYTLFYANNGDQGATGVTLNETVPAHTTFNPGASTPGWVCTPDNNAGSSCSLAIGALSSGGSGTAVFAVTLDNPIPVNVTQIDNTAVISDDGSNGTDPNPADNSASDNTPIRNAPDLSLTKDDGGVTVAPGGILIYSLNYSNTGEDATGVSLTETVPAHTNFIPWSSTPGWTCSPDNTSGSLCTLAIGPVAKGVSGLATFAVAIDNPVAAGVDQIANTAVIGDDGTNGPDANPTDNSASDSTPLVAQPDLAITKNDGGISVQSGGTILYSLAYANNGNQGATGVTLHEAVPAHTSFNPAASSAGWVCAPDNNAGSSCSLAIGLVAGGGSGMVVFAVTVDNPIPPSVTQINNTAVIDDDGTNGTDPNPADNSDSDSTPVSLNSTPSSLEIIPTPDGVDENGTTSLHGNFIDPDSGDIHTVSIDWGDGNVTNHTLPTGDRSFTVSHQYLDDDPSGTPMDVTPISVMVTDQAGGSTSATTSVEVRNLAPQVGPINDSNAQANINEQPLSFSAGFTDVGSLDSHTAVWDWGDGTTSPGTVSGSGGSGSVSDSHTYTTPGIYMIILTVIDDDTGVGDSVLYPVIICLPDEHFITGGGHYYSPEGAYPADPSLTGHANFGFVARYQQGEEIPSGNLQFQFQAGEINFHATSFDWLVIDGSFGQLQGSGIVNGAGNYGFILTAVDAPTDRIRLKIWDKANGYQLIYDTQPGASDNANPTLILGDGSIVIH